jgi:death-on-curing protein
MTDPKEPLWLSYEQVVAIHSSQLRRFGGAPGLRDEGMLRSALERPLNKWQYEQAGFAALAAAYAFGLAKNHAFVDGNKRIGWITATAFLTVNGAVSRRRLAALDQDAAYDLVIAVCTGELRDIEEIAQALRALY